MSMRDGYKSSKKSGTTNTAVKKPNILNKPISSQPASTVSSEPPASKVANTNNSVDGGSAAPPQATLPEVGKEHFDSDRYCSKESSEWALKFNLSKQIRLSTGFGQSFVQFC